MHKKLCLADLSYQPKNTLSHILSVTGILLICAEQVIVKHYFLIIKLGPGSQCQTVFVSSDPYLCLLCISWFFLSPQGIKARVYETFVVLLILGLLVFGMVWVASAILDNDSSSRETLGSMSRIVWIC